MMKQKEFVELMRSIKTNKPCEFYKILGTMKELKSLDGVSNGKAL